MAGSISGQILRMLDQLRKEVTYMIDSTNPRIMADNIRKLAAAGSGGSTVVPNPEGQATEALEKLGIDGTIYAIPVPETGVIYSTTEQKIGSFLGDDLYMITVENNSPTSEDWTQIFSDSNANIIGIVESASYCLTTSGGKEPINRYTTATNYGRSYIYDSGTKLQVEYKNSNDPVTKIVVTLVYTKIAAPTNSTKRTNKK